MSRCEICEKTMFIGRCPHTIHKEDMDAALAAGEDLAAKFTQHLIAELTAIREKCERLEGALGGLDGFCVRCKKLSYSPGPDDLHSATLETINAWRARAETYREGLEQIKINAKLWSPELMERFARETLEKGEKSADSETRCTCGHKRIGHYDNGACSGKNSGECNCTNFEEKK